MGEVDTNLPIRDFCVSGQGVVAAVLDGTDVTWIYLYDSAGNTLANFKTTMKSSGYPISISLSPNAELLCVSYLYPEEGSIKTSVAFFNFGSVGQNEIDNYASGYDYPGVVVPYVQFMNASSAFAMSDDRIMFYAGAQIPTSRAEHLTAGEEIAGVYCQDDHVALLFHNSTEEGAYRLQVYDTSGEAVVTLYFDQDFEDILLLKDRVAIYGADAWLLYDMHGNKKFDGTFEDPVRLLAETQVRNRFMAVSGSKIEVLELR
jgi:hypothetical protein